MLGYAFTWLTGGAVGSWDVNVVTGAMPQKVATAFGELPEKLAGAKYEPIAYVGKQLVNGVNHAVVALQTLVTKEPTKNVVLMKFNEHGMDCNLISIEPILQTGAIFGGTTIDPKVGAEIDPDALKAFADVTAGWVGCKLEPVALLGSKVVKGVDLTWLAVVTPVYPDAAPTVKLITTNSLTKTIDFADIL